jgi:hypothetical protein
MSDLNQMEVKQLRNEVQLLRDELAIFKRKYEDIIYNLDDDNFSSTLLREKEGMKTSIEVNAEGIKTKVSNDDFESAMTQTAELIETKVSSEELETVITQTASEIKTEVNATTDGKLANYSTKSQTASEINSAVSLLDNSISSIRQTAKTISSRVESVEGGEFNGYTLFEQTNDQFFFDGQKTVFTGCIYLTDNQKNKKFSLFHNEEDNTVYMWDYVDSTLKIVIGDDDGRVYVGDGNPGSEIATRNWVLENGGSGGDTGGTATAVFG